MSTYKELVCAIWISNSKSVGVPTPLQGGQGWVMEFHDICPSKLADFCQYRDLSLMFDG